MDKRPILDAIAAALTTQLETAVAALADAQAGATSDEARPENKYDTRALETSYLAEAHTERVQTLRRTLANVHFWQPEPQLLQVAPGALVELAGERAPRWVFLLPFQASAVVTVAGRGIQVLQTSAPLAAALMGKQPGDTALLRVAGQVYEVEVLAIDPDGPM